MEEEIVPKAGTIRHPGEGVQEEIVPKAGTIRRPSEEEGWISGGVDAGMVVLSPVALVAAFLFVRAIAIRSRPLAEREAARRALGVWPRLLIVLSCFWSSLLLGLVAWVAAHGEQVYPTWQTFVVTIAPLLGMWVIYFAARWIRQGAA